jgi:hypothetical protein
VEFSKLPQELQVVDAWALAWLGLWLGGERGWAGETEASTAKKLTEEEQMALYDKELKENDWGHQPC